MPSTSKTAAVGKVLLVAVAVVLTSVLVSTRAVRAAGDTTTKDGAALPGSENAEEYQPGLASAKLRARGVHIGSPLHQEEQQQKHKHHQQGSARVLDKETRMAQGEQNCVVSDWVDVSACTHACGGGTQQQMREVIAPPSENGRPCPALVRKVVCNENPCDDDGNAEAQSVDCVLSEWENIGGCSQPCNRGTQRQGRKVLRPASNGGAECGPTTRTVVCNPFPCKEDGDAMIDIDPNAAAAYDVDCVVGPWRQQQACTKACGGGVRIMRRDVVIEPAGNGAACPPLLNILPCNTHECARSRRAALRQRQSAPSSEQPAKFRGTQPLCTDAPHTPERDIVECENMPTGSTCEFDAPSIHSTCQMTCTDGLWSPMRCTAWNDGARPRQRRQRAAGTAHHDSRHHDQQAQQQQQQRQEQEEIRGRTGDGNADHEQAAFVSNMVLIGGGIAAAVAMAGAAGLVLYRTVTTTWASSSQSTATTAATAATQEHTTAQNTTTAAAAIRLARLRVKRRRSDPLIMEEQQQQQQQQQRGGSSGGVLSVPPTLPVIHESDEEGEIEGECGRITPTMTDQHVIRRHAFERRESLLAGIPRPSPTLQ
ncbi:hypothetical protein PTSG_09907 [Salpingoeca rosetta]|uniref:Spondin-like TSP1 domain-containing protein n=1 Tax=Salpingoeca rosetta (strain ATCC 50818 / BSB-021) TaxID=946362 RepID=F2UNH2_SALR5|nr:uncharacterized protein PTSG_09907 [Salpingoeca rosetta]EGD79177.1 hypothetical protein PTSG_09907 [Salpingoeca rosetta]|eukprot:XP_004989262.1 hypothetical protein PTSG_09907 [Salpingoeca rosetta]